MRTTFLFLLLILAQAAHAAPAKPKLVLMLVIDQFRADYLTRFESRFLPARSKTGEIGGFRYLMEQGAYFPLGEYMMSQCETGPGHATIATGAYPYQHGISINTWFDAASSKMSYCVEDAKELLVGIDKPEATRGVSPRNLIGSTIGDEIKNAGHASRVVTISLKDRSAVLLGGKRGDLALWFEPKEFKWVSSRYYVSDGALPHWVKKANADLSARKGETVEWKAGTGETGLSSKDEVPAQAQIGEKFPHKTKVGERAVLQLPFSTQMTSDLAITAIDELKLGHQGNGKAKSIDLLGVSISGHDYLGHHYGPNSRQMEELTIAEDREISRLLNHIKKRVGLENTLIAFTADHGVQPHPAQARMWRYDSDVIDEQKVIKDANALLAEKFGKPGKGDWIAQANDLNFWLNPSGFQETKAQRPEVEAALKQMLAKLPGVSHVITSTEHSIRRLPPGIVERQVNNTYFPSRSGEVVIIPRPYYTQLDHWYEVTHVTGHNYDRRVPIVIAGPGVKPGRYATPAEVIDIAPTLSYLLGILPPALAHGRVLAEALGK